MFLRFGMTSVIAKFLCGKTPLIGLQNAFQIMYWLLIYFAIIFDAFQLRGLCSFFPVNNQSMHTHPALSCRTEDILGLPRAQPGPARPAEAPAEASAVVQLEDLSSESSIMFSCCKSVNALLCACIACVFFFCESGSSLAR